MFKKLRDSIKKSGYLIITINENINCLLLTYNKIVKTIEKTRSLILELHEKINILLVAKSNDPLLKRIEELETKIDLNQVEVNKKLTILLKKDIPIEVLRDLLKDKKS